MIRADVKIQKIDDRTVHEPVDYIPDRPAQYRRERRLANHAAICRLAEKKEHYPQGQYDSKAEHHLTNTFGKPRPETKGGAGIERERQIEEARNDRLDGAWFEESEHEVLRKLIGKNS